MNRIKYILLLISNPDNENLTKIGQKQKILYLVKINVCVKHQKTNLS